jgi:hypothetical protein
MSHPLHVMLAAFELDDFDLVGSAMALDPGGHATAVQVGRADPDIVARANHQDPLELDGFTLTGVQFLPSGLPRDSVLPTTGFITAYMSETQPHHQYSKRPLILMIALFKVNQIPSGTWRLRSLD